MNQLRLSKLHATGNDFLVRLALNGERDLTAAEVARVCDRHLGIGADGLITVGVVPDTADADCSFRLQNADGGDAEMSGNGIRALAAIAASRAGLGAETKLRVSTPAGLRSVELSRDAATREVIAAVVDMGAATFEPSAIGLDAESSFDLSTTVHGVHYVGDAVGMGNPHWVVFVNDVATARVAQHGRWLETDDRFVNRTNVEFIEVLSRDRLKMRVWERGVGETLSCGTGACAAAAAAHRRGLIDGEVVMEVRGGELSISLGETVRLGGPVVHVFDVDIDLEAWK